MSPRKAGIQALFNLLETHEGKTMVIGTHGNIMVLMMNYFDERYDFQFWENLGMPDIYKLVFDKNDLIEVKELLSKSETSSFP